MAAPVPIPIDLSIAAAPLGWQGNLPDFFNLFQASTAAQLDPTFLTGRTGAIGDPSPAHDIGPFWDGFGWWFWDPLSGQYQPDQQGCPIGTIAMWGGPLSEVPARWLLSYGQQVSRKTYSQLFGAVGETWGPGDQISTFNLPPGGVFFINASGWIANPLIPLTPSPSGTPDDPNLPPVVGTVNPQGVASLGGSQTTLLTPANMPNIYLLTTQNVPGLEADVRAYITDFANGIPGSTNPGPGTPIPNVQPAGFGGFADTVNEPVTSKTGVPTGGRNQQAFSIMPPFVAVAYMVKYL